MPASNVLIRYLDGRRSQVADDLGCQPQDLDRPLSQLSEVESALKALREMVEAFRKRHAETVHEAEVVRRGRAAAWRRARDVLERLGG